MPAYAVKNSSPQLTILKGTFLLQGVSLVATGTQVKIAKQWSTAHRMVLLAAPAMARLLHILVTSAKLFPAVKVTKVKQKLMKLLKTVTKEANNSDSWFHSCVQHT